MKLFSTLPIELVNIVLEYDGKIICPKMNKSLQDDIINYYKNTNKYIMYHYNFYPNKMGVLNSLCRFGSKNSYVVNHTDLFLTYNYCNKGRFFYNNTKYIFVKKNKNDILQLHKNLGITNDILQLHKNLGITK